MLAVEPSRTSSPLPLSERSSSLLNALQSELLLRVSVVKILLQVDIVGRIATGNVSRRFVDELRGAMIRQGAQQGLLITISTFPSHAEECAQENALLPIRLIDGDNLLDLLFRYQLGVKCKQGQRRLFWRLDRAFFRDLLPLTQPELD